MITSRLSRSQERKLTKRLFLAIAGSIGLLVFVAVFGLKILINFSLFMAKIRGDQQTTTSSVILLPPTLDPLPEATNAAVLSVTGRGKAGLGVSVYLNGNEYRKLKVGEDGTFTIRNITFKEGDNTVYARLFDGFGNKSEPSATASVSIKKKEPTLEISTPNDNDSMNGDDNILSISGKTDVENSVTVNGRIAAVSGNGTFSLRYSLNEGDNTITIIATDLAGNQKKEERHVSYHK